MSVDSERLRSVTLRVAIFFGLTTFTLCIAIFYIESILDDTRNTVQQKDSTIQAQAADIQSLENDLQMKSEELRSIQQALQEISADAEEASME